MKGHVPGDNSTRVVHSWRLDRKRQPSRQPINYLSQTCHYDQSHFSWCFHKHMSVCQRLDRSCVTGTWQLSRTSAVIPPTLLHVVTQRLDRSLTCTNTLGIPLISAAISVARPCLPSSTTLFIHRSRLSVREHSAAWQLTLPRWRPHTKPAENTSQGLAEPSWIPALPH